MNGFVRDGIVLAHQSKRRLVVEVLALTPDILMRFRQQFHGFAATVAAFFATGDAPLSFLQRLLGFAVLAWILHDLTVRCDEKDP